MSAAAGSRVEAGRKKLEEYKLKKKSNQKNDSPTLQEDVKLNDGSSDLYQTRPLIGNQYDNTGISSNTVNEDSPIVHEFNIPNYQSDISPMNFFDKIGDNQQQMKNGTDSNLADVLFTNGFVNIDNMNKTQDLESNLKQNVVDHNNEPQQIANIENKNAANGSPVNDDSSDEAMSSSAVLRLQQQLQFHMQTVEFLVSEKNDLASKITDLESVISKVKSQNEDLTGRLNISRHRASCLEVEYSNMKEKHSEINEHLAQALQHNKNFTTAESSHIKQCNDLNEELQETKSLINSKISENTELKKKIDELTFHLNASDLRLQQLNPGNIHASADQNLIQQNQELKQQIDNLNHQLNALDSEKNQSNAQYQQYVQQLNNQLESMSHKHEELLLENENLINRESNLIQQMQGLEKQLQSTIHVNPEKHVKESGDNNIESNNKIKELEQENSNIKRELEQRDASLQNALSQLQNNHIQITELTNTLHTMQSDRPDVAKLNAANESDRVAAQKATAQNTKLKVELESLQEAYKKMTDDKLELAELLQAEKNLSRTLTLNLADNEEKFTQTQSKLVAKDEEMIRLQAESSELEKESLKHAQILDRLNHYEAQNQSFDVLQKELEISKSRLRVVYEEKEKLTNLLLKNNIPVESDVNVIDDVVDAVEDLKNGDIPHEIIEKEQFKNPLMKPENCMHIPATEAMKKLQDRFTKLMDDIADLSDDKQRLEHLVIQLQGETDTIGEYIALYQKQRNVLKQREYEKDIQLNQVSEERLNLKARLDHLNKLVEELIKEHESLKNSKTPPQPTNNSVEAKKSDEIIHLLNEIKTCNLVVSNDSGASLENFHPCPWCSGKLITI